jgi:uridine phosphorylase
MAEDDAIVQPIKGRASPFPGELTVLVGTAGDLESLSRSLEASAGQARPLFTSRHYISERNGRRVSLVGPMVGAPYAVMIMETLIAWGGKRFLFLGWCGSLSEALGIGDLLAPGVAIIDEGTSRHYGRRLSERVHPTAKMFKALASALQRSAAGFQTGAVWTTDAIFRETPGKVRQFRSRGALAVEMELSAIFSLARYRKVEAAGLVVVSDDLSRLSWQPGFKTAEFAAGRARAREVILQLCQQI